jgi:hypothetical protein
MVAALTASTTDLLARVIVLEDKTLNLTGDTNIEKGLTVQGNVVFNGGLTVESIGSIGGLLALQSDVEFFGRPYFTKDTAGFARIRVGERQIRVNFGSEYLEQPIVTTTLSLDETRSLASVASIVASRTNYIITDKSKTGFTITLSDPATDTLEFSWIALAVKGAKIFQSLNEQVAPANPPPPPSFDITTSTPPVIDETVTLPEPLAEETPDPTTPVESTPDTTPPAETPPSSDAPGAVVDEPPPPDAPVAVTP